MTTATQDTWLKWRVGLAIVGVLLLFGSPVLGMFILFIAGCAQAGSYILDEPASARHFNKALRLDANGRHEEAVTELTRALERNSSNLPALLRVISILIDDLEAYERALPFADALAAAAPVPLLATLVEAGCLFELGRYDETVRLVQGADLENSSEPVIVENLQLLLGRAFFEKGNHAIAAEQLVKGPIGSRKRDDNIVNEFRYWLGLAYLKLGERDKAKTQLARVYATDIDFRDIAEHASAVGLI